MKQLQMWVGPVASEKTTKALLFARNMVRRGHDLVAVRPSRSRREHEELGWIVTKGPSDTCLRWPCIEVDTLDELQSAAAGATAIWIDEAMLLEDSVLLENGESIPDGGDVFKMIQELRATRAVLISALTATSEMEPFGAAIGLLLAVADRVHWCRADCDDCGRAGVATRSWRKAGPKLEQVEVGGEEAYEPLCTACWMRKMQTVCTEVV